MAGEVYRRRFDYRAPIQKFFAILTAAGAASGATALTIGATGALTGSGALAGTCSISCGASAEIAGGLGGVALSQMQLHAVGALSGAGTLAGSAAIAFGENADIGGSGYVRAMWQPPKRQYPAPTFDYRYVDKLVIFNYVEPTGILGQADVIFGGNGLLRATGRYIGSTALTFGAAGSLTGTGNLAGTSAITLTPTADLTGTASGAITGVAPFTFTPTATLQGTGNLLGVASLSLDGALAPGVFVDLQGSTDIAFVATGTLTGVVPTSTEPVRKIRFQIRAPRMRFEFL
jgi:hypothetical protein